MTIDEAIAHARYIADKSSDCWKHCINDESCAVCEKEHEQLAEWLEELKSSRQELYELRKYSYVQGLSDGYINAIDDFAKLVETWCWKHEQYNQDDLNTLMDIAEQLKEGETK